MGAPPPPSARPPTPWAPRLGSPLPPLLYESLSLEIIKNNERKKYVRGTFTCPQGWGARPTPWACPLPCGPPCSPPMPIFCYVKSFILKKIISKLSGRDSAATRRNLGGTNLGLLRSCSVGDTSLREGEIIAIVITNAPLIGRGQSPSTSSLAPSHPQTLVHLLFPILVSKSGIGASSLLVVLITPCS